MRNRVFAIAVGMACAAAAHAQTSAPLKPGLWQVNAERRVDGHREASAGVAERLKELPPEARQRLEARLKQRGIDVSGGLQQLKVCLDRESLEADTWRDSNSDCKTTYKDRSAAQWKWHSSCSEPASESDGVAHFVNGERYTLETTTTMTTDGQKRTTRQTMKGTWIGADCGDLKPITANSTKE